MRQAVASTQHFTAFLSVRLAGWTIRNHGHHHLPGIPPWREAQGGPAASAPLPVRINDAAIVSFDEFARFHIDFRARTVTIFEAAPHTSAPDLAHILNDHIAPQILAELGELVLHASAVEIGGRLAVFLGESGAGKSTLSASLARAGHRLLGDDALIVLGDDAGEPCRGEPVYPSLRLFPDAIAAVLGPAIATAPMATYSDKRLVSLGVSSQQAPPAALIGALFFLAGTAEETVCEAHMLTPAMACIRLIEQSFTLDPHDRTCGARRLAKASRLALSAPAYELRYCHDFASLPEVRILIADLVSRPGPAQTRPAGRGTAP